MVLYFIIYLQDELLREIDAATEELRRAAIRKVFRETFPSSKLFSSIDTKSKLDLFLAEKMHMVMPEKNVMGVNMVWRKQRATPGRADLVEVEESAYIVPFRENLRNLLLNDDIRYCVEHPRENRNDKVYRTVLDGFHYRNDPFFSGNPNALAIILYYDDLGIANPLGVKSTTHKLSMFYWTLANFYPELRSTSKVVNLLAIVKTTTLKKFGVTKVLEKFVSEVNLLQTEGISIIVNGVEKVFKGSLLFVAGDTPASALMGGFKESVSAYRPCRTCMTTNEEWRYSFLERDFVLRNKNDHEDHVTAVTEPGLTKQILQFWKRRYGVNGRSALLDITGFDVTKSLPQDCMHILSEGVVEISCRALLRFCILEKRLLNLAELNEHISFFDFGHLQRDSPAPILQSHLAVDSNLRQTSSQILTLAHALPFFVGESVMDENDENVQELTDRIDCHVRLLQILNVCLAYEINEESLDLLERQIQVYILIFNHLYPGCMVPKFHFLIHLVRFIRLFGPTRQQWCFRFEAAHAYFKSLVPVVRNFKNMPWTLSYRHQALACSRLVTLPGAPAKKFLYNGHYIHTGQTLLLRNLPNAQLFHKYLQKDEIPQCKILRTPYITAYGTTYKTKSIILLECKGDSLPLFGEIQEVYVLGQTCLLAFTDLQTIHYNNKLNAYRVEKAVPAVQKLLKLNELIFPHSLLYWSFMRSKFVVLLYNCRTEFFG